jgi:hypothetical protein
VAAAPLKVSRWHGEADGLHHFFPPSAIQNRHVGVGGPQHELNVLEGAGCICASLGP